MRIVVTGGAGFIGSALARYLIKETKSEVLILDKLTYAGNLLSLSNIEKNDRYRFEKIDICKEEETKKLVLDFKPNYIFHLAAESHVDKSISSPDIFIESNIIGTYNLLKIAYLSWSILNEKEKLDFKFIHISTDEVYGDISDQKSPSNEESLYKPSSPYSASKASSDHLVNAWNRTFKLPTIITHSTNNYGPYQHPEKLIPSSIFNAMEGKNIRIYGNGKQVRDWIFVEDHVKALYAVLSHGRVGESYNIGSSNQINNLQVVNKILALIEEEFSENKELENLIEFVEDRPGHDVRYGMDCTKIKENLGWEPKESFDSGLKKTVDWYLNNRAWSESISSNQRGR